MPSLIEQLSQLAERDDTEGLTVLLERWPDRSDDWAAAVEARLRAPSSTDAQKARLRTLMDTWKADNAGSDLSKIKSAPAIVKKLIELEDAATDWTAPDVAAWLTSIETLELVYERFTRMPAILWRLPNLHTLTLINIRLKRRGLRRPSLLPDSLTTLNKLERLTLAENRLTTLPTLPASLKQLVISGNPKLQLNASGMTQLETLLMNGVNVPPIGITDLHSLKMLVWRDSTVDEFPDEFLELPLLQAANIDLEDSDMTLPDMPEPPEPDFAVQLPPNGDAALTLIQQAATRFNAAMLDLHVEDEFDTDFRRLVACPLASDAQMAELAATHRLTLPASLRSFYQHAGGLQHQYGDESWSVNVWPVEQLIKFADPTQLGKPMRSMGLIDVIVYMWGHSRPEFDASVYLSQEQLDALNAKYACFGLWRSNWGYEAAHYLYVDDAGRYGSIYYHQDEGEVFDLLLPMIDASPATLTLGQLIEDVLQKIEAGVREEWEDEMG